MNNKVHKGFLWSGIMQFANHGASIVITIILARLLSPKEFGLVAMVLVLSDFSNVILSYGFGQALIQKKKVSNIDYSSVFWLNIVFGLVLSFIFFFLAPLIADLYNEPRLYLMTQILCWTYLIASFNIVPQIIFTKKLDFKSLAKIRVSSVVIAGIGGITIAYFGGGVWSLVFIEIVRTLIITILSWTIGKWYPSFKFSGKSIKSIFAFSMNILGNETISYWMDNFDKMIIGKALGDYVLGLYRQAFSFMMLPVNNIARVANSVLFPAFSKEQDNIGYIQNSFFKVFNLVSLIIYPMMIVLFVTSQSFVKIVLGDAWLEMSFVLRVFAIVGIFYTMAELLYSYYLSLNKVGLLFRINTILRILTIVSILVGLNWGINGVTIGILIISPIRLLVLLFVIVRFIGLSMKKLLNTLFKNILIAFLIGLVGLYIHDYALSEVNYFIQFIVSVISIGVLYFFTFLLIFKKELSQFLLIAKKIIR